VVVVDIADAVIVVVNGEALNENANFTTLGQLLLETLNGIKGRIILVSFYALKWTNLKFCCQQKLV